VTSKQKTTDERRAKLRELAASNAHLEIMLAFGVKPHHAETLAALGNGSRARGLALVRELYNECGDDLYTPWADANWDAS
jgi:hypothetical protein